VVKGQRRKKWILLIIENLLETGKQLPAEATMLSDLQKFRKLATSSTGAAKSKEAEAAKSSSSGLSEAKEGEGKDNGGENKTESKQQSLDADDAESKWSYDHEGHSLREISDDEEEDEDGDINEESIGIEYPQHRPHVQQLNFDSLSLNENEGYHDALDAQSILSQSQDALSHASAGIAYESKFSAAENPEKIIIKSVSQVNKSYKERQKEEERQTLMRHARLVKRTVKNVTKSKSSLDTNNGKGKRGSKRMNSAKSSAADHDLNDISCITFNEGDDFSLDGLQGGDVIVVDDDMNYKDFCADFTKKNQIVENIMEMLRANRTVSLRTRQGEDSLDAKMMFRQLCGELATFTLTEYMLPEIIEIDGVHQIVLQPK
jgi:hypothetical protein